MCSAFLGPEALIELRRALTPALPVDDPPYKEQACQILKSSCDPAVLLAKVKVPCKKQTNCDCLKCLLIQLARLPVELFTTIMLMVGPSNIARLLVILGQTSRLYQALQKRQPHQASLLCKGNIFQSSLEYGGRSYVTGLYSQEIPFSARIKSDAILRDLLVVWSDRIGVTKVEFLSSKVFASGQEPGSTKATDDQPSADNTLIKCRNCARLGKKHSQDMLSKREWVFSIPITEAPVYLRYTGIFLQRISLSPSDQRQTFWDCSKSSMILPQDGEPFLATPSQDRLFRYVPLQKASAISFAFDSGRLVAIASHGRSSQHIDFYNEADSDTLCLHYPLSETERIKAIWVVRPKNKVLNLGTCSVIVKTQMKTIWLGSYLSTEAQLDFQIELCADEYVNALCYSDPRLSHCIVAAQPHRREASLDCLVVPHFPTYQTPAPYPRLATYHYNMYYSDAPLEGLHKIQACMDEGYCLGLLLDYGTHSRTVGQFRFDKEISVPHAPLNISLLQEEHEAIPRTRIQILDERPAQPISNGTSMQLTEGIVVWWHSRDSSVVSILPFT
ncbi:hypothetical protein M3J09_007988 [Ascochyta lentis]